MTSKTLRHATGAALLLTTGALALAACGGTSSKASNASSTTTTTTTQTTTSGTAASSFAAYATCLRQNGVTLPNFGNRRPGGNGGAPPANGAPPAGANGRGNGGGFFRQGLSAAQRQKFQTAQTACAKLRPAGRGGGFFGRGGGNFNSPAFAAYRNCLSLHGVKFARPQGGGRPPASTAKMKAALTACAALRPAGFGRRPPATGSGSSSG